MLLIKIGKKAMLSIKYFLLLILKKIIINKQNKVKEMYLMFFKFNI